MLGFYGGKGGSLGFYGGKGVPLRPTCSNASPCGGHVGLGLGRAGFHWSRAQVGQAHVGLGLVRAGFQRSRAQIGPGRSWTLTFTAKRKNFRPGCAEFLGLALERFALMMP